MDGWKGGLMYVLSTFVQGWRVPQSEGEIDL